MLEVLSGVQGENSVKIIGPDLDELEEIGQKVGRGDAAACPGIKDVGLYRIKGQCNLELPIDRQKCRLVEHQRGRRAQRHPDRDRRQDRLANDRRRKVVRHHDPLARAAARATKRDILDIPVDVAPATR